MARAESLGRCTQLPSGNNTRVQDHDCGYGQQHLFRHWTMLLLEEKLTPIFAFTGRFARMCDSKNPNKHRREDNKKISNLRSDGFIMERWRFAPWAAVSRTTVCKRKARRLHLLRALCSFLAVKASCPGLPAAQCHSFSSTPPSVRIRRRRG